MVTGLSPDNELFLNQVVATGRFASREEALNEAVTALRARTGASADSSKSLRKLSPEEWIEDLKKWSDSHRPVHTFVDTSRESIY